MRISQIVVRFSGFFVILTPEGQLIEQFKPYSQPVKWRPVSLPDGCDRIASIAVRGSRVIAANGGKIWEETLDSSNAHVDWTPIVIEMAEP